MSNVLRIQIEDGGPPDRPESAPPPPAGPGGPTEPAHQSSQGAYAPGPAYASVSAPTPPAGLPAQIGEAVARAIDKGRPAADRSPPQRAAPAADDWYSRFHELQNRRDRWREEGKRLSDADAAELESLHARLTAEPVPAGRPGPAADRTPPPQRATAPPPTPPPPVAPAGGAPSLPLPPPPPPPPGPAADRTPGTRAGGDVADMRKFLADQGGAVFTPAAVARMTDQAVRDFAAQLNYQPPRPAREAVLDAIEPIADRLRKGLITLDEAFDRAEKVVRKFGDRLTDELRDRGAIGADRTAGDFVRERLEGEAEAAGRLPVGERLPRPVGQRAPYPFDAREAADRKRRVEEHLAEAEEGRRRMEEAAKARRVQQIRDVTAGIRTAALSDGIAGKAAGLGQIAASGALGERLASAATGPAGAAVVGGLALVETAKAVVRGAGEGVRAGLSGLGEAARKVADNDLGVLADTANRAADAWAKVAPAAAVPAEMIKTLTHGVRVFNGLVDAQLAAADRLKGVSGPIAGADAQAGVRRLLVDVREERRVGPDLARLIDRQSHVEAQTRELLLPIREQLLKLTNDGLTALGAGLEVTKLIQQEMATVSEIVGLVVSAAPVVKYVGEGVLAEAKKLVAATEKARELELQRQGVVVGMNALRTLQDRLKRLNVAVVREDPDKKRLDARIALPIFGDR